MRKAILAAILIVGCSPVYTINKTEFEKIPKGSKKVVASVPYSADSLFNTIVKIFSRDGWVVEADKSIMQIHSNGKTIGNGTWLKPLVYIESAPTGSIAYLSGQWGLDQTGEVVMQAVAGTHNYSTEEIVFGGSGTTKADLAFQKLVNFANSISGASISYAGDGFQTPYSEPNIEQAKKQGYQATTGKTFEQVLKAFQKFLIANGSSIKSHNATLGEITSNRVKLNYATEKGETISKTENADIICKLEYNRGAGKYNPIFGDIFAEWHISITPVGDSLSLQIFPLNVTNGYSVNKTYTTKPVFNFRSTNKFEKRIVEELER